MLHDMDRQEWDKKKDGTKFHLLFPLGAEHRQKIPSVADSINVPLAPHVTHSLPSIYQKKNKKSNLFHFSFSVFFN